MLTFSFRHVCFQEFVRRFMSASLEFRESLYWLPYNIMNNPSEEIITLFVYFVFKDYFGLQSVDRFKALREQRHNI